MIVGFTGTQAGMTNAQKDTVACMLKFYKPVEAHHGVCIGADAQFHELCRGQGIPIVGHPPVIVDKIAPIPAEEFRDLMPIRPYLVRNREIVDSSERIFATPGQFEERLRSGTWSTVRYAKNRRLQKVLMIVWPDGSVGSFDLARLPVTVIG